MRKAGGWRSVVRGLLGAVAISGCALAQSSAPPDAGAAFEAAVDQFFDQVYFKYAPTAGTLAGFHQYDTQLEKYSRASIDANIADLHAWETKISAMPRPADDLHGGDYDFLLSQIRSQLLALETVRMWEKNPDNYSTACAGSAFSIIERKFASPDERMRRLTEREKQMPALLQAARANLKNPPQIYTSIAIEQMPGDISFFENDVPSALKDAKDPSIRAAFAKSNAAVIAAMKSYEAWLKSDLLPRSHGSFALGADTYAKKLQYDEMVDIPLDRLLQIGYDDLHKNQQAFNTLAHEVDPGKTPQQVLDELTAMHPKRAEDVLPDFRATFDGLIKFIHEKDIVTIPSDVRPTLEDTPPFMRATTFASMDTPGPYENVATEAYFNVTVPEPDMTPKQKEEALEGFNFGTIVSTSVHEAYPGHYIQFLWVKQAPTKIRKLLAVSSNAEGWAHYCEQMMLDQGYGQPGVGAANEREAKFIRLGQLQDALLRDARFVVGISMHTKGWTMEQSENFFVKDGYQVHSVGVTETKRGTSDATYLYYTLGKLQIMKLRADLKAKQGDAFSLEEFHNSFLKQGSPPIKIVRKALLGDDSPTL